MEMLDERSFQDQVEMRRLEADERAEQAQRSSTILLLDEDTVNGKKKFLSNCKHDDVDWIGARSPWASVDQRLQGALPARAQ